MSRFLLIKRLRLYDILPSYEALRIEFDKTALNFKFDYLTESKQTVEINFYFTLSYFISRSPARINFKATKLSFISEIYFYFLRMLALSS